MSNSYLAEAVILGLCIYFGLSKVNINVNVNVTDKPIYNEGTNIQNVDATKDNQ